jgi:hypothetical protein
MDEPPMEAGTDMADDVDTPDELKSLVLGFLREWPSPYASPNKIARAIGRPTTAVVEELARLKRSGEYPTYVPPPPPPEPVTDQRASQAMGPAPSWENWDRVN